MARTSGIYLALASICLLLTCDLSLAQDSTTVSSSSSSSSGSTISTVPTTTAGPVNCASATAATINGTKFLGVWYEAARKLADGVANNDQCIEAVFSHANNNLTVQVTFASDSTHLWSNQTISQTFKFQPNGNASQNEVFLAQFTYPINGVNYTLKVLETDYDTYALTCAYVNVSATTEAPTTEAPTTVPNSTVSSNSSSSSTASTSSPSNSTEPSASSTTPSPIEFHPALVAILTRERQLNTTALANLTAKAEVSFSDFSNIVTVIQSADCYTGSAATTVPVLAMILALAYSLLKFVH